MSFIERPRFLITIACITFYLLSTCQVYQLCTTRCCIWPVNRICALWTTEKGIYW